MNRVRPVFKVLVGDDDEGITEMLSTALRLRGFEVVSCHAGSQVLPLVESERVDVVLLDLIMPGLNGLDVCNRLKSNPATRDLPVIIMTSITSDGELADGVWRRGTRADDFISKPFDPFEVADRINRILDNRPPR